jgi:hypothetical protein
MFEIAGQARNDDRVQNIFLIWTRLHFHGWVYRPTSQAFCLVIAGLTRNLQQ